MTVSIVAHHRGHASFQLHLESLLCTNINHKNSRFIVYTATTETSMNHRTCSSLSECFILPHLKIKATVQRKRQQVNSQFSVNLLMVGVRGWGAGRGPGRAGLWTGEVIIHWVFPRGTHDLRRQTETHEITSAHPEHNFNIKMAELRMKQRLSSLFY